MCPLMRILTVHQLSALIVQPSQSPMTEVKVTVFLLFTLLQTMSINLLSHYYYRYPAFKSSIKNDLSLVQCVWVASNCWTSWRPPPSRRGRQEGRARFQDSPLLCWMPPTKLRGILAVIAISTITWI